MTSAETHPAPRPATGEADWARGLAPGEAGRPDVAPVAPPRRPSRRILPGAVDDRLFFAQVREDSALDVEAIEPRGRKHVVAVTSAGGTVLALLAAGAERVTAVDLNASQNDLAELQAVALAHLGPRAAAYLGGLPMERRQRTHLHDHAVRPHLSAHARATWDRRRHAIGKGVLHSGVTERFLSGLVWIIRHGVVSDRAVHALLEAGTVDQQRRIVREQWDGWRWRLLFKLLLNRAACQRIYRPEFFEHQRRESFADHFRRSVEYGLSELPIGDNYFVHDLLEGHFRTDCLPPHLSLAAAGQISARVDDLELVDGGIADYLRTQPDGSVDGICLSNICEWLPPDQIEALLREVCRVAAPDTPLVIRDFVGWTVIPRSLKSAIEVDARTSHRLSQRDRSLVQRRMLVARVNPT